MKIKTFYYQSNYSVGNDSRIDADIGMKYNVVGNGRIKNFDAGDIVMVINDKDNTVYLHSIKGPIEPHLGPWGAAVQWDYVFDAPFLKQVDLTEEDIKPLRTNMPKNVDCEELFELVRKG